MKSPQTESGRLALICGNVPPTSRYPHVERTSMLQSLEVILDPSRRGKKVCVLSGMSGVGKTQIALQYIERYRSMFQNILWINCAKHHESFYKVAKNIGLLSGLCDKALIYPAVITWLLQTETHWLLVLDGAKDKKILEDLPPIHVNGSILLTSLDSTEVGSLPGQPVRLDVPPFNNEEAGDLLISFLQRYNKAIRIDRSEARKIVQPAGGVPLFIKLISDIIHREGLQHCFQIHRKNPFEILENYFSNKNPIGADLESGIRDLRGNALKLQKLLIFFHPSPSPSTNHVSESLLQWAAQKSFNNELKFLQSSPEISHAADALLRLALIARSATDGTIYIHPLMQWVMRRQLSGEEIAHYFDLVTSLLSSSFQNTWNVVTKHQFMAWGDCEKCVQHVDHMMRLLSSLCKDSVNMSAFAELTLRLAWYLYEREDYTTATSFTTTAFDIIADKSSLSYASATTLLGLIKLDRHNPTAALESFSEALKIREKCMDPQNEFIASSCNALSLAYTELNKLDEAEEYGQRAIRIRELIKSDRCGNSYSNTASIRLRLGKPDEAEAMLKKCPSIKSFSDESFLTPKDPRFSGDIFLLSRIRQAQNRLEEALDLSLAALKYRRRVLGNGLKTCAALYLVATLQHSCKKTDIAIESLKELASLAETSRNAARYRVLALSKIYKIYKGLGQRTLEVKLYKSKLEESLSKVVSNGFAVHDCEEYPYENLVPYMLW